MASGWRTETASVSELLGSVLTVCVFSMGVVGAYVYEPDLLTQTLPRLAEKPPAAALDPATAEPEIPVPTTPIENTQTVK